MAAMTRTSILIDRVPPTRSISRSWSTRSELGLELGLERRRSRRGTACRRRASSKLAELPLMGAGERAPLVAEELRLDERLRRWRRGLTATNGPVAPGAVLGGWPAPRAPCRCRSRPVIEHRSRRCGATWADRAPGASASTACCRRSRRGRARASSERRSATSRSSVRALERPARERQELVLLEGLGQVVERAELHGGHGGPDRLHRRDQDHLDALVDGLDPLEDLDPVHAGQPDVEQHEVHRRGPDDFERAGTVGGRRRRRSGPRGSAGTTPGHRGRRRRRESPGAPCRDSSTNRRAREWRRREGCPTVREPRH